MPAVGGNSVVEDADADGLFHRDVVGLVEQEGALAHLQTEHLHKSSLLE